MDPIVFLIALLFWALIRAVTKEADARARPDYWRRWGAVVLRPQALQQPDQPIGLYMDTPIFEHVRFCDCDYHFDHVALREEREQISGGELFLEPGLIYRMDEAPTSQRYG